jgi:hypothetical protein
MTINCVLGCDPELMLERKGKLISAIGIVPGSKHEPYKVKNGAIQADNVNLEFNTLPSTTIKDFVNNIGIVLKEAQNNLGKDITMLVRASANFPASELTDPEAKKFGCEPDYDAWELKVNVVPEGTEDSSFRSAGGHIHIGATKDSKFLTEDEYGGIRMTKLMDVMVGIPSLLLDKDTTSAARRKIYGGAGCHRPKEYGVEYRALSNFWIKSPELVELISEMTNEAVALCAKNKDEEIIASVGGKDVVKSTINNSDLKKAEELWVNVISKLFSKSIVSKFNKTSMKSYGFYEAWGLR